MALWQIVLLYAGLALTVLIVGVASVRAWRESRKEPPSGGTDPLPDILGAVGATLAAGDSDGVDAESFERSKIIIHGLLMNLSESVGGLMGDVGKYADQLTSHKTTISQSRTMAAIQEVERLLLAEIDRMAESAHAYRHRLEHAQQTIEAQQTEMERLSADATMDYLTRVPNRRGLEHRMNEALALYHRHGRQFALLMLDIDHFKALNDTYGHIAGDKVLRELALRIQGEVRGSDYVARYGGEEFAILLPESSVEMGLTVAEKLRQAVEGIRVEHGGEMLRVTASLGVAEVGPTDKFVETLIARSDAALYGAKSAGRNQVVAQPVAAQE